MFYGSADDFVSYHESRGKTISALWTDDVVDAALLVASEWLDAIYGDQWIGSPTQDIFTQTREWPRQAAATFGFPSYLFADDEIPDRVKHAVYEAAFRELTTAGSLLKDYTPSKYKSVTISGAISVDHNLAISSAFDLQTDMPVIKNLMKPLLDPNRSSGSQFSGKVSRV